MRQVGASGLLPRARFEATPRPGSAPSALTVAALEDRELPAATHVLARAFADNPLNVAVIGRDRDRRVRCNAHGMRALLPVAQRHGRVVAARSRTVLVGCLVASPPSGHPLPPPSLAARLRCRIGQGGDVVRRWAAVFTALDAAHPRMPHWYLGSLGVAPEAQGTGVGTALVADLLRRADAEQLPTYLETDRWENVAFYEHRGFRIESDIEVMGVPAWCMWRDATSSA